MIVLDTHVLVWLTEGIGELGPRAKKTVEDAFRKEEAIAVSAISFWEISMLEAKNRLKLLQPIRAYRRDVLELGIEELLIDGETGITAAGLEGFHADPADRLIVAAASLQRAVLLTADRRIREWTGPLRCMDARR